MGTGYSVIETELPTFDSSITSSKRFKKLENQFDAWSIDDVRSALNKFASYKHFTFDGLDSVRDRLLTEWPEFYAVLDSITLEHLKESRAEARRRRHPACVGYAMKKDPNARPPSIIEDERASEGGESASGSEGGDEENVDYIEDDADDSNESGPDKSSDAGDGSSSDSEDDKSSNDGSGASKSSRGGGSHSDGEGGNHSDGDAGSDREEMDGDPVFIEDRTPLRADFDPRAVSPMFYGYTRYTTQEEDHEERAVFEEAMEHDEADAKAQEKQEMAELVGDIEAEQTKINGMREARGRIRTKKQRERDRLRGRRLKEKQEAQKAYDESEFRSYEVSWEEEESRILAEEEEEDAVQDAKDAEQDLKWDTREDELRDMRSNLELEIERLRSRPRGEKFVRRSKEELRNASGGLQAAKAAMAEAERDVQLSKQNLEEAKPNSKDEKMYKQLLFAAEGKLQAAEASMKESLGGLDESMARLDRAKRLKQREDRFVPVYASLVDDKSGKLGVLDAMMLVAMNSSATIEQKVRFCFDVFDFRHERLLDIPAFVALLATVSSTLERVGNVKKKLTDREVKNMAMRAFLERQISVTTGSITVYDFEDWATAVVTRVKDLSEAFRVVWKFDTLSEFERKEMDPIHMYRLGLISLENMQWRIAAKQLRFTDVLSAPRKMFIHERAMNMGADDPTKADYSKYMPKKKSRKYDTKMVPLTHGMYCNLNFYYMQIHAYWATRLQAQYRAHLGRAAAGIEAQRQAFYAAKELARSEAEARVREEYDANEALGPGTKRMKWDAKIRMQQVKLRTKGLSLNRSETVRYMIDSTVNKALKKVEKQFHEMEKERGFKMTERELKEMKEAEDKRLAYLRELEDARREAEEKEREEAELALKAEENEDGDEASKEGVKAEDAVLDFDALMGASERKEMAKTEARRQLIRRRSIVMAEFPPDIFDIGETDREKTLRQLLSNSNPSLVTFRTHLRNLNPDLTEKRIGEMTMELPSKRLLLQYARRFRDTESFAWHLNDHFGILKRQSHEIARSLFNMASADYEYGRIQMRVREILDEHQFNIRALATSEAAAEKEKVDRVNERRIARAKTRMAGRTAQTEDDEENAMANQLQMLADIDHEELEEAETQLKAAREAMAEAEEKLSSALLAVSLAKRRVDGHGGGVVIDVDERTAWNKRLMAAHELPENNDEEILLKYTEMASVFNDFLHCSQSYGETIINEMFLGHDEKSIKPFLWRETDQKNLEGTLAQKPRGIFLANKKRPKWQVANIRFKVAIDDDGMYNGCIDACAKAYGKRLSGSIGYIKSYIPGLITPMMCLVDYRGFRLLAEAVMPLEVKKYDQYGVELSSSINLVMGSNDRGLHIVNDDAGLHKKLGEAAERMNLAQHGVKGKDDLSPGYIWCPADMRGYRGSDDRFYIHNFGRTYPPEHPEETLHLRREPRDMSIFWRLLRPELVQRSPMPLSSDALSMFADSTPDEEEHSDSVRAATKRLIGEVIPEFAEWLSERSDTELGLMDLKFDLHRAGINARHLGLLRSYFWFKLKGCVHLTFNSKFVHTTVDMTADLQRAAKILVMVPNEEPMMLQLSKKPKAKHSAKGITLEESIMRNSLRDLEVWTGIVKKQDNSNDVRDILVQEMALRALKGLARKYMRETTRVFKASSERSLRTVVVDFLNLSTGSHPRSEEFWREEVLMEVNERFGMCALNAYERQNLKDLVVSSPRWGQKTFLRLPPLLGLELTSSCRFSFRETPLSYVITPADIAVLGSRTKHNLNLLEFSGAQVLSVQGRNAQGLSYQACALQDKPIAYWRLSERLASRVAFNTGSGGMGMSGYYNRTIVFEVPTGLQNDFPSRGVRFEKDRQARIDVKFHKELSPFDSQSPFSVGCWCKLSGGEGTYRVLGQTGRWTLGVKKDMDVVFGIFVKEWRVEITVSGGTIEYDTFYHIMGTFDGVMARIYVQGTERGSCEIVRKAQDSTADEAQRRIDDAKETDDNEEAEKEKTSAEAKETAKKWLADDPQGQRYLQSKMRILIEKSVFKLKMTKNAEELGLRKLTKKEARKQAIEIVCNERAEEARVAVVNKYKGLREDKAAIYQKMKEDAARREFWALRIGSACPTAREKAGRNWWVGDICHFGVWQICLSADRVAKHYLVGTRQQSGEAARLFKLAAEKFEKALAFSHDDQNVLNKYADTLCHHAGFGAHRAAEVAEYHVKVRKAIKMFRKTSNCDGIKALIGKLPQDDTYGDLFCDAWRAVEDIDPKYFSKHVDFIADLPTAFSLYGEGTSNTRIQVAADVYRTVVKERPNFFSRVIDLQWLFEIKTPAMVVYLVNEVKDGADLRDVDLSVAPNATCDEMERLSDYVRDVMNLSLVNCRPVDATLQTIVSRCHYLRHLNLAGCTSISNEACTIMSKNCQALESLSLDGCRDISDEGLSDLALRCTRMENLNLNHLHLLTDNSLTALGETCHRLRDFSMCWMPSVTDRGMFTFATYCNATALTRLDISACRKIGDDGIMGIAERMTNLTDLNMYYCNKITDRGCLGVTHNLWRLERLVLNDLYQLTDRSFHFDREGDGRPAVDAHMLEAITELDITDCNRITDFGLASISARCTRLTKLCVSGVTRLTERGAELLAREPINGEARGDKLEILNLTFCQLLGDKAIGLFAPGLGNLAHINLTGCTKVSDEGIKMLTECCPCIQILNISHCRLVTDRAMFLVSQEFWVEGLDISYCPRISDEGVCMVLRSSPGILSLNVAWCRKLTDRTVEQLMENCKSLKTFNITALENITSDAISALKGTNKLVHVVSVELTNHASESSVSSVESPTSARN